MGPPRGGRGVGGIPQLSQAPPQPVTYADLYREREFNRLEQELRQTQAELRELRTTPQEAVERTMTVADEQGNPMVVP